VVIKAQQHRSQEMNRQEALDRLHALVADAAHVPKSRRPTKPTRSAKRKRLESKIRRGRIKQLRGKVQPENQ
jgi:ribosome-associated protein